jgi:hypothetical protein
MGAARLLSVLVSGLVLVLSDAVGAFAAESPWPSLMGCARTSKYPWLMSFLLGGVFFAFYVAGILWLVEII